MSVTVLRDHVAMPWANGGGTTLQVARFPADGDFDWRISLADMDTPGPFSVLPGIDRVLVLSDGGRIGLTADGVRRELGELEPFAFPGETPYVCDLPDGPARDLNVMTRRGRVTVELNLLRDSDVVVSPRDETHIIVVLRGTVQIEDSTLAYREAAVLNGTNLIRVSGAAAHIALTPVA